MTDTENQRAGFAAIIGAPNAGKSTLVNRLTGTKVSIVTQKVQTTRFPVRGIAIEGDAQIILVDTPGIFTPRRRLDRAMVASAWGGADDADVVVHLVDAASHIAASVSAGSPGAGASSTTFWCRRCTEQSRVPRATAVSASATTCTSTWRPAST